MNLRRYVIISILVWIVFLLVELFQHSIILKGSYLANQGFMRIGGADIMILNLLGGLIFSFAFCYIFVKGYEGKGIMEGIRFGLIISALIWIPKVIFEYANFNFPGTWPLMWFMFGVIATVLCGIVAAFIYRPIKKPE